MINTLHFQTSRKSNTKNLLFPKVPCVVSLYTWIQENGCIIKERTPTPFRNYRPSAKGLHLIDTFSACTGEKPGKYLIPYFSGFCPAWTIREHYYDTKKTYLIVFFSLLFGRVFSNLYICVCRN